MELTNNGILIIAFCFAFIIALALIFGSKVKVFLSKNKFELDSSENEMSGNISIENIKNKSEIKVKQNKEINTKIKKVDDSKIDLT